MKTRFLTPEDVEYSLVNLTQLVFEVTDDCNLSCIYCAYGDFYCDYDKREKRYLRLADVKLIIDYLAELWQRILPEAAVPDTYIGFYGGEPLLNMPFIKEVINYIDSLKINRRFKYSLTTNAVLLDRYMSYLVEKDFRLLISLDGDEGSNSYRVNSSGYNPFKVVFQNIVKLKEKYPSFYDSNVNFNSVLHNRNDVETIMLFFKDKLSKMPDISELSPIGINPSKREEFKKIFNGISDSFHKSSKYEQLSEEAFDKSPEINRVIKYIELESNNIYDSYDQLLPNNGKSITPTGTCIPFSRKMFITVNGKILPCERISHAYYFGKVTEDGLSFDIPSVVNIHNGHLKRILRHCKTCAGEYRCTKCIYQIDDLNTRDITCESHVTQKDLDNYNNKCFKYLKSKYGLYRTILESM